MIMIRPAVRSDIPLILALIHELAVYEREPDAVKTTEADLLRDGFGPAPRLHSLLAEADTVPAAFALYFYSYSTWKGRAGIYLEDLFVRPEFRDRGIGKALLSRLASIALAEGCARLEWSVLDWNQPAIDFYHRIGARMKTEWRGMRVSGDALRTLAGAQPAISKAASL